jgi:hypothetical protein
VAGVQLGHPRSQRPRRVNVILTFSLPGSLCHYRVHGVSRRLGSVEDDRLIAITKDPVLQVPADRPCQDNPLKIPAPLNQILFLIAMRDTDNILLNDRPFVQHIGHVVACRADQLYTSFERGPIGSRSTERWQKRMVHVDDPLPVTGDKGWREDLHITSKDHQIDGMTFEKVQLRFVGRFGGRLCGNMVIRYSVKLCQRTAVGSFHIIIIWKSMAMGSNCCSKDCGERSKSRRSHSTRMKNKPCLLS